MKTLLLLCVFVPLKNNLRGQISGTIIPHSSIVYNVERGEKAIFSYASFDDYLEKSAMSKKTIRTLSDNERIYAALNHPAWLTVYFYHFYQEGVKRIIKSDDIFKAVLNNTQDYSLLLDLYNKMEIEPFNWALIREGGFSTHYLELLLAQNQLLEHLKHHQQIKLLTIAFSKYRKRAELKEQSSYNNPVVLMMGRILMRMNNANFIEKMNKDKDLRFFLRYGAKNDVHAQSVIVKSVKLFLKENLNMQMISLLGAGQLAGLVDTDVQLKPDK